jgi:hypothetical protein
MNQLTDATQGKFVGSKSQLLRKRNKNEEVAHYLDEIIEGRCT